MLKNVKKYKREIMEVTVKDKYAGAVSLGLQKSLVGYLDGKLPSREAIHGAWKCNALCAVDFFIGFSPGWIEAGLEQ